MPIPRKTQKQIAQRYVGNLQYYRFLHPFRRFRILMSVGLLIVGAFLAFIGLKYERTVPGLERWNSPGDISQAHAAIARNCQQCHAPDTKSNPLQSASSSLTPMDRSCIRCHSQHEFHQVNVTMERSCTACHLEHVGRGPMPPVADANCLACHGDAATMAASREKGLLFPAQAFAITHEENLFFFPIPRPSGGCTRVIHSFAGDHPDFQIQRDHLFDPNTLKFNHEIHLSGSIPRINGHKLDCAYCHQPDSQGAYMQSISFEKSCQACHALQIDPQTPGFQIPHPRSPDSNSVRNFILTLPTQYAAYATQTLGMTQAPQIAAFVNQRMEAIRQRAPEAEDMVKEVFYSDAKQVNWNGSPLAGVQERALFPGCAYCHEVKPGAAQIPVVTPPITPDRWFVRAKFSHAAHSTSSCESCHGQVLTSTKTSDISLPDKASCVVCHSVKGGAVSTCVTCHGYHNTAHSDNDMTNDSPLREMMLGGH